MLEFWRKKFSEGRAAGDERDARRLPHVEAELARRARERAGQSSGGPDLGEEACTILDDPSSEPPNVIAFLRAIESPADPANAVIARNVHARWRLLAPLARKEGLSVPAFIRKHYGPARQRGVSCDQWLEDLGLRVPEAA